MERFPNDSEDILKLNTAFNILKESIDSGKLPEFDVVSNSMLPLLRIADKVTIGNITPNELKLGDIVVYKRNGYLCVHRYIYALKKQGRVIGLVTKGDNRFDFDAYLVSVDQLIGKVIAVNRQDTKIKLENFFWREINYSIGILSFAQAFILKVLRYLKSKAFSKTPFPFFKQIITFPFSISIKSIKVLAYLNKKTG